MNPLEGLARSPLWSRPALAVVANVIVVLAFVLVAAAVVVDFRRYHRQDRKVVSSDRSFVDTGSMTVFFIAYYLVVRFRLLEAGLPETVRTVLIVAGLALLVVGVAFNIWGRLLLGSRWSNQIMVYADETLLTTGPYAIVRHPLYASLIWIFIGGALIYSNPLSLVLTLAVFVPMMVVRAEKEDAVLLQNFTGEYEKYRSRTGMFFPRVWR
jgi:protein-S-isoprenylcysteine O-methyltransferase Ste14